MTAGWPLGGAIEGRPWRTTAYGLGVMTGTGPEDSRVIGHTGPGGPGSVIAVYHLSSRCNSALYHCGLFARGGQRPG